MLEDLAESEKRTESGRKRLLAQIVEIEHARVKWAEKAMAEVVPPDIARAKQQNLALRLTRAETELAALERTSVETKIDVERIFELAKRAANSYQNSSDDLRREWNYSRYSFLAIDVDDGQPVVAGSVRTPIFEAIHSADLSHTIGPARSNHRRQPMTCKPSGSRVELLVEVRGLEPPTSPLRTEDRF